MSFESHYDSVFSLDEMNKCYLENKESFKNNKMTTKSIGRLALFKYSLISVAIFFTIPVIIVWIYQIFTNEPVKVATFFNSLRNDLKGNELFVLIQIIVVLSGIRVFGGVAGRLIITRKRSKYFVGWLTIFLLWVVLSLSCFLTDGVINFLKYGKSDLLFESTGWLGLGLSLFGLIGAVHGLLIGYFIGNEIYKIGCANKEL